MHVVITKIFLLTEKTRRKEESRNPKGMGAQRGVAGVGGKVQAGDLASPISLLKFLQKESPHRRESCRSESKLQACLCSVVCVNKNWRGDGK